MRWHYSGALETAMPVNRWIEKHLTLFSGRIGATRNADFGFGLSALTGRLLTPSREIVQRSRIALDSQYYYRNLGFLGEISVGRGYGRPLYDKTDFLQFFSELHWKSPKETSQVWLQLVHRSLDPESNREIRTGVARGYQKNSSRI